jgi:hypothetical protein
MAIKYHRGDEPHDPFSKLDLAGYSLKRGKMVPAPKSSWGQRDEEQKVALEQGKQLLDEALRD